MSNRASYIKVPETGIYMRDGYAGIPYSDGSDLESRMLQDMIECPDVSDSSIELRQRIRDWPSEYHFSPQRANLLRPFSFAGLTVLELGCGCGALTRFLGESGAKVVAVEGSPVRAAITAARCRDLPNVSVYCDNIAGFESDDRFDVVTLIGVLEYARVFLPSAGDAIRECLEIACSFLAENGSLYLAIENQLGLKYFNGCAEDHTGIPFFGVNDRYSATTAVTFGKKELADNIRSTGFKDLEFFFPFPDYKLPELIVAEQGLSDERLRLDDLLCRMYSRDYGGTGLRSFNEGIAWRVLARNGLAGEMANSFLIKASLRPHPAKVSWLAQTFNNLRLPEFAIRNRIVDIAGALHVEKDKLFSALPQQAEFQHFAGQQRYVHGQLHIAELQKIMECGGQLQRVVEWGRPWIAYLREHVDHRNLLPEDYVDCIPTNLIRDANGRYVYIDVEWRARERIPFIWVAARGVVLCLSVARMPYDAAPRTYRKLTEEILAQFDIRMEADDWRVVTEWEDALRACSYGGFRSPMNFSEFLDIPCVAYPTALQRLREAEQTISQLTRSRSWRLTRPWRTAHNIVRRLFLRPVNKS